MVRQLAKAEKDLEEKVIVLEKTLARGVCKREREEKRDFLKEIGNELYEGIIFAKDMFRLDEKLTRKILVGYSHLPKKYIFIVPYDRCEEFKRVELKRELLNKVNNLIITAQGRVEFEYKGEKIYICSENTDRTLLKCKAGYDIPAK